MKSEEKMKREREREREIGGTRFDEERTAVWGTTRVVNSVELANNNVSKHKVTSHYVSLR